MKVSPDSTVREMLHAKISEPYVDYVCAAYGAMTVRQLLEAIQETRSVDCHSDHELTGASYVDCPLRKFNILCNHQCEVVDIKHPTTGEIAVPKEQQIHVTGLLRAGLLVLDAANKTPSLSIGGPLTQSVLDTNAEGLMSSDNPAFLEFDRFRDHSHLVEGSPPLEDRIKDRLPQFMAANSLPELKVVVNAEKRKWQEPTDVVKNAVQAALEQLLSE